MTEQIDLVKKVLIANRGEIACWVIEPARPRHPDSGCILRGGSQCEAVRMANEAALAQRPRESYLVGEKVLEVAQERRRCLASGVRLP